MYVCVFWLLCVMGELTCWPGQSTDVSKSVKHDEESQANLGEEEHANTLQDTDTHQYFWLSTWTTAGIESQVGPNIPQSKKNP